MTANITQLTSFSVVPQFTNNNIGGVASSSNGSRMYACFIPTPPYPPLTLIVSTNYGVSWSQLNGTPDISGQDFRSIACNGTGSIIYLLSSTLGVYKSTNSGNNWTLLNITGFTGGDSNATISSITCDSTGNILILATFNQNIYVSTNGGTSVPGPTFSAPNSITSIACNLSGSVIYAVFAGIGTNEVHSSAYNSWATPFFTTTSQIYSIACNNSNSTLFINTGITNSSIVISLNFTTNIPINVPTVQFVQLAPYNNGANLLEYDLNNAKLLTYSVTTNGPVVCFGKGTKILCLKDGQAVYRPIEEIKPGDLVKTSMNGYLPVNMIGHSTLKPQDETTPEGERLYVCRPDQYDEVFEDLILTGFHGILVFSISPLETTQIKALLKDVYVTDTKYRLPACLDKRAKPYPEKGPHTIWHLALDNDDYYANYGIYANGLLVESCSKRYIKELSKMTLVH